jgi:sigma-B regulation protein RsbU (phosphoserine phosphatase)
MTVLCHPARGAGWREAFVTDTTEDDESDRTITMRAVVARTPRMNIGHYLAFSQDGELRRVPIVPGGVVIGRSPPADIVIPVADISRKHCRIDVDADGEWAMITDLGSTNGTFVGGERVQTPAPLRNGSALSFGSFALRYERRDKGEVAEEAELASELRRAADYVRAILPQPISSGQIQAEWWFVPSSQLGGDAFGYQFLDDGSFTGFVLDVSGHGIGSAMHAANVANVLRRRALPGVDFRDPAQVAAGLNAMFPMEEHNGLLLTLWYFAYEPATRQLRFCAAGHHPSFLVSSDAPEPVPLWLRGPTIGMLPSGNWMVGRKEVPPGSRLYVFSDGAFEIVESSGRQWVIEDLRLIMKRPEQSGISESQRLYQAVRAATGAAPLEDDFSVLVVRFA